MARPDLSPKQAAEQRGVHRHTIYMWIRKGQLPAYKLNGTLVRIRQDDLDKLLRKIPA